MKLTPIKAGIIIKELRTSQGLTLRELSKLSGVGYSTIHDIESGKAQNPKVDTLEKLANVFNINIAELLPENEKLILINKKVNSIKEQAQLALNFTLHEQTEDEKQLNTIIDVLETKKMDKKKTDLLIKYIEALYEDK